MAELSKNREADMGNPNFNNFNIYHTIDEDKVSKSVEHLYDEIKHKNREFGEWCFGCFLSTFYLLLFTLHASLNLKRLSLYASLDCSESGFQVSTLMVVSAQYHRCCVYFSFFFFFVLIFIYCLMAQR